MADYGSTNDSTTPPRRRRLPESRWGVTRKFRVGQHKGYLTMNRFPDGTAGEIFVTMDNEGSTIRGLMDTVATLTSIALQYGVPVEVLAGKFAHVRFEPSGPTGNPDLPMAPSVVAHVFRLLGIEFVPGFHEGRPERREEGGITSLPDLYFPVTVQAHDPAHRAKAEDLETFMNHSETFQKALQTAITPATNGHSPGVDTRPCEHCGCMAIRRGSCYHCPNCFETSGCS